MLNISYLQPKISTKTKRKIWVVFFIKKRGTGRKRRADGGNIIFWGVPPHAYNRAVGSGASVAPHVATLGPLTQLYAPPPPIALPTLDGRPAHHTRQRFPQLKYRRDVRPPQPPV